MFAVMALSACVKGTTEAPTPSTGAPTPAMTAPSPAPVAAPLKLLKTSPERGPVGTKITLTGSELPPGKEAEVIWATMDGKYDVAEAKAGQSLGLEYRGRIFTQRRASLGRATIGSDGAVSATFAAPEDLGEVHDIYLAVDGQDVAKGGFRLMRRFTMTPMEGPVGTPITIKVTGLGWQAFESTVALRYDNKYTGFISSTTTRGTAVAQFRAAGPVGKHFISVDAASHAEPFLNIATGGRNTRHLLSFETVFTVTKDDGPPPARVDLPDAARVISVDKLPRIPIIGELIATPGVSVRLSPASGPVLTEVSVKASGLSAGTADLVWVTERRSGPFGMASAGPNLATVKVDQSGSIDTSITVPEDVGGWHVLSVVQNGKVLTEAAFYTEQSIGTPVPVRVKEGEKFTVWFRGGGWTELDNGAAVTYDNAYIGYACGYANNGDTPIELVATGGAGTHLIDIYPYIFDGGHGDWPWQYNLPQLTFAQDHPGLSLGYKLPAYRFAIEVVP
ncbi:MAG: hypothetical protein HYX81_04255 [Chloroflexi bacterium]|nr:hypothetical protein [Chloroflexota bacterium]